MAAPRANHVISALPAQLRPPRAGPGPAVSNQAADHGPVAHRASDGTRSARRLDILGRDALANRKRRTTPAGPDCGAPSPICDVSNRKRRDAVRRVNDALPPLESVASPELQPGKRLFRSPGQTCRHDRAAADCCYPHSLAVGSVRAFSTSPGGGGRPSQRPSRTCPTIPAAAHRKLLLTMSRVKIGQVLHG